MIIRNIACVFTIVVVFLFSCDKSEQNGPPVIEFNIVGVEASGLPSENASRSQSFRATGSGRELVVGADEIQRKIIPFDDKLALEVILTPEEYITNQGASQGIGSGGARASLQQYGPIRQYLPAGTRYRVVIYQRQSNGTSYRRVFNEVYDVTASTSPSPRQITLANAGVHRFVVYSVGSTSTVPDEPQNEWWHIDSPLPSLPWNPSHNGSRVYGNQDFMCYTEDINVTAGINYIDVVLKNMFSQITTTIKTSSALGDITHVLADVSPHHQTPTITFNHSNGNVLIDYGTSDGIPLTFQNLPSTSIETPPVIVCNDGASPSSINFSSVTINGQTKGNFSEPVALQPGRRYILSLNVTNFVPDLITPGIEIGGLEWARANVIFDGSTYGFAEHQYNLGSFWRWNWEFDLNTNGSDFENVLNSQMGSYTPSRDPCNKITGESGWRTPTVAEVNALYNALHVGATYGGVDGRFFGTNSESVALANPDQYVFLPVSGRIASSSGLADQGSGYYWTQVIGNNNWGSYSYGFNKGWPGNGPADMLQRRVGLQIRCVRTP